MDRDQAPNTPQSRGELVTEPELAAVIEAMAIINRLPFVVFDDGQQWLREIVCKRKPEQDLPGGDPGTWV